MIVIDSVMCVIHEIKNTSMVQTVSVIVEAHANPVKSGEYTVGVVVLYVNCDGRSNTLKLAVMM